MSAASNWPPTLVTFRVEEGREFVGIQPWEVREGMLAVATTWDHDARHLSVTLRKDVGCKLATIQAQLEQILRTPEGIV